MGVELFLILFLLVLVVAAVLFLSGAFGGAKAREGREGRKERPQHAYVENDTKETTFGSEQPSEAHKQAESDPNTDVRGP